jgi:hypothetical protein
MKEDKRKTIALFKQELAYAKLKCFEQIHDYVLAESTDKSDKAVSRMLSTAFKNYSDDLAVLVKNYIDEDASMFDLL